VRPALVRLRRRASTEHLFVGVLVAVWAGLYLYGLGDHPLRVWDESRYAVPARNMVTSGNWLDPQLQVNTNELSLDPSLRLVKPPLLYWLQATAMTVFGSTVFAARLPSALATLATAVLVYHIATRTFDRRAGLAGGLAFLIFPGVSVGSHAGGAAVPDPLLTLCGSLFVWLTWRGREQPRLLVPAGIAAGLAVMTKGVAAGVFVIALVPLAVWARRRYREHWRSVLAGVASTLVVALPWHLYAWLAHPQEFVDEYFIKAVITRIEGDASVPGRVRTDVEGSTVGPEIEPVFEFMNYPYLKLALGTFVPPYEYALPVFIVAFVLALVVVAWLVRRDGRARHSDKLALCWWAAAVPLTFAVVGGNQPWYILPMYVPAMALVGYVPAALLDGTLRAIAGGALARLGIDGSSLLDGRVELRSTLRAGRARTPEPELVRTAAYVGCCVLFASLLLASFAPPPSNEFDYEQRALGETIATEVPEEEPVYAWFAGDAWRRALMSVSFYADRTYVAVSLDRVRSDEQIRYAIVPIGEAERLDVSYEVVAEGPDNYVLFVRFPDRIDGATARADSASTGVGPPDAATAGRPRPAATAKL
jgi:4-amino-4-deoxy-L-arabinose transferase-like glycosyltransferase